MKNIVLILFLSVALLVLAASTASAQQEWMQPVASIEIDGELNVTILPNGVAEANEVLHMSAAAYKMFKAMYNPISTFIRGINRGNQPAYLVDVKVEADDANNLVRASYRRLGAAVYLGNNKWVVDLGDTEGAKVKLVAQKENTLVFTVTYLATSGVSMTETIKLKLPDKATHIKFDPEENKVYYELPLPGEKNTNLLRIGGAVLVVLGAALAAVAFIHERRSEPEIPPPPA